MDLTISDEQRLIVDSAAAFLGEASAMRLVRACSEDGDGFDRSLWRGMAELGWCGVRLPAEVGGLGAGWVELVLLQEQLGRRLACVPFFDSAVLATTVLQAVPRHHLAMATLIKLATGELVAALALAQPHATVDARVTKKGETWELNGHWRQIGSAQFADSLLLTARDDRGEPMLFLVPANTPGLSVEPLAALDATRRCADVSAQALLLPADACLASGAVLMGLLARTRCLAAITLAAEQVGVAQQALDLTLAYTMQRVQFGKPIASFQAVKHRCAQMLVALETARSAVYEAACAADTQPDPSTLLLYAAQARDEATHAALLCTREAIQLHGGVGFTWEFDPHLYFRRAQVSSHLLASVGWWREQVAALLLDSEAESLSAVAAA